MEHTTDVDQLFSVTYDQLRRMAARVGENHSMATLNPTSLVNEAYLKLAGSLRQEPESRLHFKRIAARAMRQVIVEAIRRRRAVKRGGEVHFVTLDPEFSSLGLDDEDVLHLDEALKAFALRFPRQAEMVECRFFAGYDVAETAAIMGVSESTVARDWRVAA